MEKFIVDFDLHGYTSVDINNDVLRQKNIELVIVLNENSNNPLKDYYNTLSANIRNGNKVILINVAEESKYFKSLATLMTSFRVYNIYNVVSKDIITNEYIDRIYNRKPDFNEVQTYIGGDIALYSEISTLMFGIENLIEEGNIQGLEVFLQQHMTSLENLTTNLDYMKTICEMHNTNELVDKINDITESIIKHKEQSEKYKEELKTLSEEKETINTELNNLKKDVNELRDKNEQLKESLQSGSNIVNSFSELNTSLINCKVPNIMYFKEVSYVPYMNTLISMLMQIYAVKKIRAKLLIYDNKTELYNFYKPLNVVNGKDYMINKENLLKRTDRFVITEPAQVIIKDILTAEPKYDIVIIYDKMKTQKDVVIGNNVTKFFVINSKTEYERLASILKIVDESKIFTRSDSTFSNDSMYIPYIDKYKGGSDSNKISKYLRLKTSNSDKTLIDTIHSKARININIQE